MPKAASTSTSTTKKAWTPRWKFDFPTNDDPCRDEKNWRKSKINGNKLILKTDAQNDYHLKPVDMLCIEPAKVQEYRIPGGRRGVGIKTKYKERDVELAAWRKYGSPEHFERFLREAKVVYPNLKYPRSYYEAVYARVPAATTSTTTTTTTPAPTPSTSANANASKTNPLDTQETYSVPLPWEIPN